MQPTSRSPARSSPKPTTVLGFALSELCFDGPLEELTLTANTQPALLTVSCALTRVLREELGLAAALGRRPQSG